jgi:hypothetical protein
MRTLLLATLALASSLARPADACGPRPPKAFAMHSSSGRSFVLLGEPAPENLTWTQLRPHSFDDSATAPAAAASHATTITLLGERGARVISTSERIWFAPPFHRQPASSAIEIPRSQDFEVALLGDFSSATWLPFIEQAFERVAPSLGLSAETSRLFSVGDAPIRVATGWNAITGDAESIVLEGKRETARLRGTVVGGMMHRGRRYLFLETPGAIRVVWL